MFLDVANHKTATIDLGGAITVRLNIPTGYKYLAFTGFSASDWTVVLQDFNVQEAQGYIEVIGRKMISGSSSVTVSASIVCRKVY